MKLSKTALNELLTKCEKRFPAKVGTSMHNADVWTKFCDKSPVEFSGELNGAKVVLRVNSDGYAIHKSNSYSFFEIHSFKFDK